MAVASTTLAATQVALLAVAEQNGVTTLDGIAPTAVQPISLLSTPLDGTITVPAQDIFSPQIPLATIAQQGMVNGHPVTDDALWWADKPDADNTTYLAQLKSGQKSATVATYYFLAQGDTPASAPEAAGFTPFTQTQKDGAVRAMQLWQEVCGITFVPVESSNIAGVGYDNNTQTLYVAFKNGSRYFYQPVPEPVYTGLLNAPSKGRYLNAQIIGRYKYGSI